MSNLVSSCFTFKVLKRDSKTRARIGKITTSHGTVETPAFMPVGTNGSVKAVTPEELEDIGYQIVLANIYHLYLRPGPEVIKRLGGIHRFMHWHKPILTDSGGFQIYSLSRLIRVGDEGAEFRSHIDGSRHSLSPEMVVEIQEKIGTDIMMCLDQCVGYPASRAEIEEAVRLTTLWAERSKEAKKSLDSALFGIIQGGIYRDMRRECVERIIKTGFDGYAIGGVSVGEPREMTMEVVDYISSELLPEDQPRYLMGVGAPEDLVEFVPMGIDMFDCVLPTRVARNGLLLTRFGKLNIKNSRYATDQRPVDEQCQCYTCRNYSRGYLRHLFMSGEILAARLSTIHNLYYIMELMTSIKKAIRNERYKEFKKEFYKLRENNEQI